MRTLTPKNLHQIVRFANELDIITTLITNGNTITAEKIRYFKNNNVTLVFSLHTLNKEKYESDNKCKNSFNKKINAVNEASEVYKETKTKENGFDVYRIAIHATLQRDNIDEIDAIREFCSERDMFFSIAPLALSGNALENPEIHFEDGEKEIEDVIHKGDNSIIHSHSSAKVFGREVCGTAFYGLNIGWDGAILLDAHYGYEIGEKNLLGNIRYCLKSCNDFQKAVINQRKYAKTLFENIDGSCPVRDPKGKEFLEEILKKQ